MDGSFGMSEMLSTTYWAPFAGQKRAFRLRLGEIEALEGLCRAGVGEIAMRLVTQTYKMADVRETLRLGLMGGGMSEPDATATIMANFDDTPLSPHVEMAAFVLSAALTGVPPPKRQAEAPSNDAQATSANS